MADHTPSPNTCLALTLAAVASHHGKRYCYPSQETIARLAARHYGWRRSRATIARHTRALEQQGLIRRVQRHRREPGRGWTFRSTLYLWTRAGWRWITSIATAIRGWAIRIKGDHRQKPCLNTETLSPPSGDNHARAGPLRGPPRAEKVSAAAPPTHREEAIKRLEALKGMLQGRQ